ncbi:MAG: Hpt domain-containing protein [Verrucomicrobia bacterium]|nr:Hpt domain-containing protein [Verrucomicrobiota bacterium]
MTEPTTKLAGTAAAGPLPVFDREALLERLFGDEQTASLVLQVFLEDADGQMRKVQEALDSDDARQVRFQSHTLHGAAANVGALALAHVAAGMELAGSRGDLPEARAQFPGLEFEMTRFKTILQAGS